MHTHTRKKKIHNHMYLAQGSLCDSTSISHSKLHEYTLAMYGNLHILVGTFPILWVLQIKRMMKHVVAPKQNSIYRNRNACDICKMDHINKSPRIKDLY